MYLDLALSNYDRVLKFEQAQLTGDYVIDIVYKMCAIKRLWEGQPNKCDEAVLTQLLCRYDDIRISAPKEEPFSNVVSKQLRDSWIYTQTEMNFVPIAQHLRNWMAPNSRPRCYGHTKAISTLARGLFGLYGATALLAPLVALTYIKGTKYRLVTTILFVLTFVFLLVRFSNITGQDLVAATIAYAALLAVILGSALG